MENTEENMYVAIGLKRLNVQAAFSLTEPFFVIDFFN